MKKYLIIIAALSIVYILTFNLASPEEKVKDKNNVDDYKDEIVSVFYENQNFDVALDDYVINVLACEMPALFDMEALKAGAVAIRTFYLYKKNSDSSYIANSTDQCYINEEQMHEKWKDTFDKYYERIREAVTSTKDEVILYNNDIIESFYFSMSNGYTENLESVFKESRPYLVSVNSTWDLNVNNFEKSIEMSKNEFLNKLKLEQSEKIICNIDSRSDTNRVNLITVNGVSFTGVDFRKLLSIRSTDFDISVNESNIVITTRGYGHGVGMSQYGANEMAKLGYSYEDILKHYYSGVEISKLSV